MATYNILSIDGGGMKGLISAMVIEEIEKKIQIYTNDKTAKIADYYDMIAGTSTGSILAAFYLMPDDAGRPKYQASDATKLYINRGKDIFDRSFGHRIATLFGLLGPKYSNKKLYNILDEYLGTTKISNLVKPCLITSYDIRNSSVFFFATESAKNNDNKNYFLKDAVLASSAAPTYFPPVSVCSMGNKITCMIDGGICCNNPALCAFTEAMKSPSVNSAMDISICSVGNIINQSVYTCKSSQNWGKLKWSIPLVDTVMNSGKKVVDYELTMLYKAICNNDNYLRLEKVVSDESGLPKMDDASNEAIVQFQQLAREIIESKEEAIDEYVKKLLL